MLEAKGLFVVEDLLAYLPLRYEDRSNLKPISQLAPGEMATVIAEVRTAKMSGFKRKNLGLFEAAFTDSSGETLNGKWFHGSYLANVLVPGLRVALFGKIELDTYTGHLQVMHPEFEVLSADDEDGEASLHTGRIVPIYEAAGKITTRIFRSLLKRVLDAAPTLEDPLPEHIRQYTSLPKRKTSGC
jgi:ATP-dependent DNA helicase RecG